MRRLPLWVLALALCAGCHSVHWRVASQGNIYFDLIQTRVDHCSGAPDPRCAPCRDALNAAERDFKAADDAIQRGGSIKPQETRLAASIDRAKEACSWASSK